MPKIDNSILDESNVRVTRASRRAGSVDLDLEQSSHRTPLKSNILETISETGSVDSRITPRGTTRRSVLNLELGTPQKKSQLTKENLARLDNISDSSGNPLSASKRITRRTSITSEETSTVPKIPTVLPFVRLSRTRLSSNTEEITDTTKRRGRPKKNVTTTPSKVESKSELHHYNTRRSVSSSPSTNLDESKNETSISPTSLKETPQKTIEQFSSVGYSTLENTPVTQLKKKILNQTSTPNLPKNTVEINESTDNATIEIVESEVEDCDDNSDDGSNENDEKPLAEYYRKTSLKKFTGIIQNNLMEEEQPGIKIKLTEEIVPLNKQNDSVQLTAEPNDQINSKGIAVLQTGRTVTPNNKSKLSLSNISSCETQQVEINKLEGSLNTCNSKSNDSKLLDLKETNENEIDLTHSQRNNKSTEESTLAYNLQYESDEDDIILSTFTTEQKNIRSRSNLSHKSLIIDEKSVDEVTTAKITPTKSVTLTPSKFASSDEKRQKSLEKQKTPVKQLTPAKQTISAITTTPLKSTTPAKQGTPGKPETPKQTTPAPKQVTPAPKQVTPKQATPAPKQATPAPKQATPAPKQATVSPIQATPAPKQATPAELSTSLKKKEKLEIRESATKCKRTIELNEATNAKCNTESPKKTNTSQLIESNLTDPNYLFMVEEDVVFKVQLENSVNDINDDLSSPNLILDECEHSVDTFENFTDNMFRKKSKSCSPKVAKKNLVQSQINNNSFHGVLNLEKELEDQIKSKDRIENKSKTASGIFTIDNDHITSELETTAQDISTSNKNKDRLTYIIRKSPQNNSELLTEDDNLDKTEKVTQDDVSKTQPSSLKKRKKRSLSIAEPIKNTNVTMSGSFVEMDNYDENGKELSTVEQHTTKNNKRQSSNQSIAMNTSISGSFVESDNQIIDGESEDLKLINNSFVTKRKPKESKLLAHEFDIDNQPTDNDLNSDSNSILLNSSKSKKHKLKPSKVVVSEKRKISMEEIEATCNKILQERELAKKMLREQFSKKKDKNKLKKRKNTNQDTNDDTELIDNSSHISCDTSQKLEQQTPKSKKRINSENKQKSINSSQSQLNLSVASNDSVTSKEKKLIKSQNHNASPLVSKKTQLIQIQLPDSIEELPLSSNRRLSQSLLNQLDEKKEISQDQIVRGEKRKFDKNFTNTNQDKHTQNDSSCSISTTTSKKRRLNSITSLSPKKLIIPTFNEKEKTPEIRPSGFKESPITPKILSNNFRVQVMRPPKMPKKKLKFKEPTNVLPQPVWTTAGIFKETDVGQENFKYIAHSTTNFIVEDIGSNRGHSKVDKHRKVDLIEFKKKNLFRSNVPRANAKHCLKSMLYEKGNIKYISK